MFTLSVILYFLGGVLASKNYKLFFELAEELPAQGKDSDLKKKFMDMKHNKASLPVVFLLWPVLAIVMLVSD